MLARRSILKAGLAATLVPAAAAASRAQDAERSRDVIQVIATAKGQAENLLAAALYTNLSAENGNAAESANERVFGTLNKVLGGIPGEEAALYAEPAQTLLAEALIERSVPLMPETLTPLMLAGASEGPDDLIAVAGDIVKDAFGVTNLDVKGLLEVASELALLDVMSRIGAMIRADNWALAAQFLRALLTQLSSSVQAIPSLEKALGEQAVKEILTAASARFAPFIGWPVLVAAILFAIMRHRNRLLAALEKSR